MIPESHIHTQLGSHEVSVHAFSVEVPFKMLTSTYQKRNKIAYIIKVQVVQNLNICNSYPACNASIFVRKPHSQVE